MDPISREESRLASQYDSTSAVLQSAQELKDTMEDLQTRYMSYSNSDFGVSNHERDVWIFAFGFRFDFVTQVKNKSSIKV